MAEKVDSPSTVPMGYAQWVSMTLCNLSDQDIKVKNVVISEGKLYADGENIALGMMSSWYSQSFYHRQQGHRGSAV